MMIKFIVLLTTMLIFSPTHAGDFDPESFVAAHNKWRAEAGVIEKLSYSSTLASSAQSWADNLKLNFHCQMHHSRPNGMYGENLYWASAVDWSDGRQILQQITPNQVVASWGKEKADYDYKSNSCKPGKMCGHYTQLVWRSTRSVGCAMAVCEDTKQQVWVCQYQPAGNWIDHKPY
jgi:pathogenesis-related protein 1